MLFGEIERLVEHGFGRAVVLVGHFKVPLGHGGVANWPSIGEL
jgi:hypothetical protein